MEELVQSILIPTYYGKDQADLAVFQMGKCNRRVKLVGDYFCYTQFRLPYRVVPRIRYINDLKIILTPKYYPTYNI